MAQKKHLWPLFLLPAVAVLAFVWLAPKRPGAVNDAPAAVNTPKIADLGSRGRDLPAENAPAGNSELPTNGTDAETPVQPPPEEEATNSAREIDIYLGQLAHATKVNDGRGIGLAHESLKKCRPHELVDERVLAALESERNAFVRTQFFAAYHANEPKLAWAARALELRAGKFLGTDETYEPGEVEELKTYATTLLRQLMQQVRSAEPTADPRPLAFARGAMDSERPVWALELTLRAVVEASIEQEDLPELARAFEQEVRGLLERGTATIEMRGLAFFVYAAAQTDIPSLLGQMDAPWLRPYTAALVKLFPHFNQPGTLHLGSGVTLPLAARVIEHAVEVSALAGRILASNMPTADKQALIQTLCRVNLPKVPELLDAGIQRKDANLGDYLAAWGFRAASPEDLKLLAESAAAADSATATGAIEGLRQCALSEAAAELNRIVEQGNNPGVQSQALGALLARDSANAATIVESYLGTDRDPSVRAVAVAHIPAKNIDRMKKVIDEDGSPRVRQAALTRLGEMKDKKLRSYFNSVAINDPQPLIRQQAKKYADELKDQ